MAKVKMTIPISVEKLIHKAITEAIQSVWNDQNLLISKIKVNWIDISTHDKLNFAIQDVMMTTQTIKTIIGVAP